jgi:D-lactate dehydrogenase (cytochrome)
MDRRCLELLREDGLDARHGVELPRDSAMALLITLDLPPDTRAERAVDEIARALDPDAPDGPLARFCRMLADAGMLEGVAIAPPGDRTRAARLLALREAVPEAVNQRVARAREADCRIEKTAADMIVPFDRLDALLDAYDDEFRRRDLDAAVWGHISDGNLHPNVLPRSIADVESGKRAILELGRRVLRFGGAPLAEHGVGRNPVKQRLLQEMYGEAGIEAMRRVKRALDPEWKLSPGVLFPP